MLPRWQEAFPKARAARLEAAAPQAGQPVLVWLRLVAGIPAERQIASLRERFGQIGFVVLSDIPNDQEAIAAFSAAARGYCNSHAASALLRQVADVVLQGGIWIGEGLMQRLLNVVEKITPADKTADINEQDWAAPLTEREREVALVIAEGQSNREIAARLGITERTVKAHVGMILNKLQVRDRLQLALVIKGR